MENFANRRRNYYINKKFQRNFIMKFCGLVALGSLISGVIIYITSSSTVTTTFENSRLTIKNTAEYILPAVLLSGAVVVVLIGLAAIVITLLTSHRIAGPLYRMEKDIHEFGNGNLNIKFRLRAGDELKALLTGLNVMAYNMRGRVEAVKRAAADMEAAAGKGDGAALRAGLGKLKEELDKFSI